MNNEIVYSSKATDQKAQYDASAKRLLGQKIILAHILIRVVDEFKGMDADTVASLIEGEPYISQIPVEPGLTNKDTVDARTGERIVGLNTENSEIDEGKVYFDIVFYVRMRDGLAKMIINLEAQKNESTKYHILNRAIFYTAGEFLLPPVLFCHDLPPQFRIAEHMVCRQCRFHGIIGGQQNAASAQRIGNCRRIVCQNRQIEVHRFHQRHTEALVVAHAQEHHSNLSGI